MHGHAGFKYWAALVLMPMMLLLTATPPLFADARTGEVTIEDQAYINVIERYRPDFARELKGRLERVEKRIEDGNLNEEEAEAAREAAFESTRSKAERAEQIAEQFGSDQQQVDAARATELILLFRRWYLDDKRPMNPALRIAHLEYSAELRRLEEERRRAEEEERPSGSMHDTSQGLGDGIEPYVGFRTGEVDLPDISFLRTELGGMVVNRNFGKRVREVKFHGFDAQILGPITEHQIGGKQIAFSAFAAFSTADAEIDQPFSLDAAGNQLGIRGVEGAPGALGGGLVTGPGFGDVTDGLYSASYEDFTVRGGGEGRFNIFHSPWELGVRAAFLYGETEERSIFGGVTNGGTVNFAYDTKVESERLGGELGLNLRYPLFSPEIGIYGDAVGRFTSDDATGRIELTADLNGSPFPSETQHLSDSAFSVGGLLGGGLYVDLGPFYGFGGVEYETFNVPTVEVTGTDPAEIEFERRDSVAFKIGFSFELGATTVSDIRLKRDIARVGRLANGLNLYRYRYLWSDAVHVGVMAQEVQVLLPEAVVRGADGFLRVDYARLGPWPMRWQHVTPRL